MNLIKCEMRNWLRFACAPLTKTASSHNKVRFANTIKSLSAHNKVCYANALKHPLGAQASLHYVTLIMNSEFGSDAFENAKCEMRNAKLALLHCIAQTRIY